MNNKIPDTKAVAVRSTARSLPIALLRAREKVMAPIRAMLADVGVTEQQWRVLRVLAERGAIDPTEIALHSCLLMPSLTRILKVLEAKAYVTRSSHATDGRRAVIKITAEGRALIERNIPQSNEIFAKLEAQYGKERIETLLDLLNDLTGK
jgi:homoprotocatechuate degradation regulator HpaR